MTITADYALGRYIDRLARAVQDRCSLPWEDARQELWVYYLSELVGMDAPLVSLRLRERAMVQPQSTACRRQPESLVSAELRRRSMESQAVADLAHIADDRAANDSVLSHRDKGDNDVH